MKIVAIILSLLLGVSAYASSLRYCHLESLNGVALLPNPFTEALSRDGHLTVGPSLDLIPGEATSYPRTSLLNKSHYLKQAFISLGNGRSPEQIAALLAPGNSERAARYAAALRKAMGQGLRAVSLADYLPTVARQSLGHFPDRDGPNCFNTALRFNDRSLPPEETTSEQMIRHLQKDYVQLKQGDSPQFGDVVVVWMPTSNAAEREVDVAHLDPNNSFTQARILHAAVYLDRDTLYQKASATRESPVVLEDPASALRPYQAWDPIYTVLRPKHRSEAPALPLPRFGVISSQ